MPWHKPRFKLLQLVVLVAVLAVEFALLPSSFSTGIAIFTLVWAILVSVSGPLTRLEWVAVIALHILLIAFLAPAVKHSSCPERKPGPSATTGPPSAKI